MDTSLNKEARGQNRAFEETVEMVRSELSKDGKTLDLTACYLKEYGAKDLARMEILKDLASLELGTNLMGAKGVKYLANSKVLTNLTSLNLFYNAIGNEGVKFIAISDNLLSLQNLTLSDNNITDEGAKYLAKFLPLWTNLRRLDLRLNKIREEGQAALREAAEKSEVKQILLDKFEGFNVKGGGGGHL
ncbi:MAG: hypothetical protein ACE5ER_04925 [Nitrospinaceae bacterium]